MPSVTVTLTQPEIFDAVAIPVLVVTPSGSGTANIITGCVATLDVSTPFTGGGNCFLQYGNGALESSILAVNFAIYNNFVVASSNAVYLLPCATTYLQGTSILASSSVDNQGIYFTNDTAVFTDGNFSTITLNIEYTTVNL